MRPVQLGRLIDSIAKMYRIPKIIVLDTGGNLSAARNKLVDLCDTPYYMMLEEDMILLPQTNMPLMWNALESDKRLAGVSGGLMERGRVRYCAGMLKDRIVRPRGRLARRRHRRARYKVVDMTDSHDLIHRRQLIRCNVVYNWGLFRTDVLRDVRWNEELELSEHYEFFYRLSRKHYVACSRGFIGHTRSRPSHAYKRQRGRIRQFKKIERYKMRLRFHGSYDRHVWKTIDDLNRKVRRQSALVRRKVRRRA